MYFELHSVLLCKQGQASTRKPRFYEPIDLSKTPAQPQYTVELIKEQAANEEDTPQTQLSPLFNKLMLETVSKKEITVQTSDNLSIVLPAKHISQYTLDNLTHEPTRLITDENGDIILVTETEWQHYSQLLHKEWARSFNHPEQWRAGDILAYISNNTQHNYASTSFTVVCTVGSTTFVFNEKNQFCSLNELLAEKPPAEKPVLHLEPYAKISKASLTQIKELATTLETSVFDVGTTATSSTVTDMPLEVITKLVAFNFTNKQSVLINVATDSNVKTPQERFKITANFLTTPRADKQLAISIQLVEFYSNTRCVKKLYSGFKRAFFRKTPQNSNASFQKVSQYQELLQLSDTLLNIYYSEQAPNRIPNKDQGLPLITGTTAQELAEKFTELIAEFKVLAVTSLR